MSKTLTERLAAATALVAKLQAQIDSENIVNNVALDDTVTIKYGRAEKVRNVSGKIVGIRETENGKSVVVLSDDFKTYTVAAKDITVNEGALARASVEQPADESTVELQDNFVEDAEVPQFADYGAAGEDPLSQD